MPKKNQNTGENIIESKREIAHRKKALISECQTRVFKIHLELLGYSALFRNVNSSEFKVEELYGVSLFLERQAKRLERISDLLIKAAPKAKAK